MEEGLSCHFCLENYFEDKEAQNFCHAMSLFSRKWKNVLLKLHRNDPIICEPFRAQWFPNN